jgi:hypothetical protein
LSHWEKAGIPLNWLADSERRLAGKSILSTKIYNNDEFKKNVK